MDLSSKQIKNLSHNKWYHATLKRHLPSLLEGIKVDYNLGHELDFGAGFYITSDFQQAQKYINRLVEFLNTNKAGAEFLGNLDEEGIILEFELTDFPSIFTTSNYKCHYFKSHNISDDVIDFAEFVFQNRLRSKERIHDFDFIYGVQTDDNPTGLLQKYKAGLVSKADVLNEFRKPFSFKQLSIHNQEFCDIMKVTKIYLSKDGKELDQWQKQ
ncbi:DUF3990 domain-containing protein [Streptococcus suis]|uniref:DUF3990 domain-containing protein n=1 Tax=Streptococcus suis TaxID=1307 RepID=A0A9X4RTD8_STRSU|nr:DUF3990 domain-containing protein [Streptococcus suis]MDG3268774.1 DUF3990 domain-containing protein [Streptococcus suis]MDG4526979.1 DUF3990 domain-containing protein [Streptococcus suis]MDG4529421.1 DUF3990 domain-containing protein [Streptococcus suis]CYY21522.1 Uncharacterised protein [Streptococcus suis]